MERRNAYIVTKKNQRISKEMIRKENVVNIEKETEDGSGQST